MPSDLNKPLVVNINSGYPTEEALSKIRAVVVPDLKKLTQSLF